MKKWKQSVLATGLCAIIASAAATGCAVQMPAEAPVQDAQTEQVEDVQEAAVVNDEINEIHETTTIRILLCDLSSHGETAQHVIDAMNAITEEKIGVVADVTWADLGSLMTQISLAMAGNESFDLIQLVGGSTFSTMLSSGQLMDVTEILEEEAPDLLEVLGGHRYAMASNGRYYGVPTLYNQATSAYILMRKDILDELDLVDDVEAAETWQDMEKIFATVKEEKNIAALCDTRSLRTIYGSDVISEAETFDTLGDTRHLIHTDDEGHVDCLLDNEAYRKQQDRIREWWQNGYVYQDILITDQTADMLMADGVSFAFIHQGEIGIESQKEQITGYPIYAKKLHALPVMATKLGLVFPMSAAEPEAAAKWLNELYTNPDMENLITWGVEGVDYVVEDGIARYPDGVDSKSVQYHSYDYLTGNCMNALPWEGTSADFRDLCRQEMANAPLGKYYGFLMDTADLDNVVAAVSSVQSEYNKRIYYGAYTDEEWDAYRAKLSSVGFDELLESYQSQLDTWRENN